MRRDRWPQSCSCTREIGICSPARASRTTTRAPPLCSGGGRSAPSTIA